MLSGTLLEAAIPGILALLGALGGLAVGYLRWHHERRESRGATYRKERREAYKKLIENLEEAHLLIRSQKVEREDFGRLLFDVNAHLLMNAIYIEEKDRVSSNNYLKAVYDLDVLINNAASAEAPRSTEIKDTWSATDVISWPEGVREFSKKYGEAESLRQTLISRAREVAKGGLS